MDNRLSPFEICVTSYRNVYFVLLKEDALQLEQIKALELHLTGCIVLVILPINRLWKELNLSSVLFGKAFCIESECEHVSDFATQHQVNCIVEEQFLKYELIELGVSAVHFKD